MATRYFKSHDGHMVCTTSSGNRSKAIPGLPHNSFDWTEIKKEEFYKLKRRIQTYQFPWDRVNFLINTSVEDMQSSLYNYKADEPEDVEIIRAGLKKCVKRGEKTKAKILQRKLKKMEAENGKANPA